MKNSLLIMAGILMLALLSSCASSVKETKYYPVVNNDPRQSSLGFSITPPPGDDWFEKLKNDSLLYLKINKDTKSYTILTEAREVHLDQSFVDPNEFKSYVKQIKDAGLIEEKSRNKRSSYSLESGIGEYCVRYRHQSEVHSTNGSLGEHYVDVTRTGLFCRHPQYKEVAIDISYLEKSFSDTDITGYAQEGEKFLSSLSFHASL